MYLFQNKSKNQLVNPTILTQRRSQRLMKPIELFKPSSPRKYLISLLPSPRTTRSFFHHNDSNKLLPFQQISIQESIDAENNKNELNNKADQSKKPPNPIRKLVSISTHQPEQKIKKSQINHFIDQSNSNGGGYFNTIIRCQIQPMPQKRQNLKGLKNKQQQIPYLWIKEEQKETTQGNQFEYTIKYSVRTSKGIIPSQPKKVNQDNYLIYPHIGRKSYQHFFTVLDGHGSYGHLVSTFLKQSIPISLNAQREQLETNPPETLTGIFEVLHDKLLQNKQIDTKYSGSTIVSVYMNQDELFCANVGDSRAILGQLIDGKWSSKAISRDHKPSEVDEASRIRANGGRIDCYKNYTGKYFGPQRVWLLEENTPGLAMTRSMGDQVAASVGVTHEPEIIKHKLTLNDLIMVLGSDGLFEYLSNDEIIDIVSKFQGKMQIENACDELLIRAQESWQKNSNIQDDITFILFFMIY